MVENFDSIDWNDETSIEFHLSRDGIMFGVEYVGCIEIKYSVKDLDRDLKRAIAYECINRIHSHVKLNIKKKGRLDKKIRGHLSDSISDDYSQSRVILTISAQRFEIKILKFNDILCKHEVPNISFGSMGDGEMSNYVAYVGKDMCDWRACYVLNCGPARSRAINKAIHKVFQMRTKKFYTENLPKIKSYRKASPNVCNPQSLMIDEQKEITNQNQDEIWFHGKISLDAAEDLLKCQGDFLVHVPDNANIYVLSCFSECFEHIRITDSEGKITMKNKSFESVKEFVTYHFENHAPIITPAGTYIFLEHPV